jgi:hypothetical protein
MVRLMKNNSGFSLIMFLFYLTLNSMIICCLCSIIVTCVLPSIRVSSLYHKELGLHLALDVFVREIRSSKIVEWKLVTADTFIFNNGENDIGWRCYKNKFERIVGTYIHNHWQKRRINVIAQGVSKVMFSYDFIHEKIIGIECILTNKDQTEKTINSYVAVRF